MRLTPQSTHILNTITKTWKLPKSVPTPIHHLSPQSHLEMLENKYAHGQFSFLPTFFNTIQQPEHISYQFTFHNRTFFLNIVKSPETTITKLQIQKIMVWLNYASAHAKHHCSKTLTINLVLTPKTKYLPTKGIIPNIEHVNTAFTTSCSPLTEILIYREEEWFKVFIHETMHCLGFDFSELDVSKENKRLLNTLYLGVASNIDLRIYESYCEFWGELLNILFCWKFPTNVENSRKTRNRKQISRTLKNRIGRIPVLNAMISNELVYTRYQCAKILDHYSITYEQLLNGETMPKYVEKSHLISYYFLKLALWENMNETLEWCVANHGVRFPIQFVISDEGVTNYTNFLLNVGRLHNLPKTSEVNTLKWKWLEKHGVDTRYIAKHMSRDYECMRMSITECS